jgi:hypothetical protein
MMSTPNHKRLPQWKDDPTDLAAQFGWPTAYPVKASLKHLRRVVTVRVQAPTFTVIEGVFAQKAVETALNDLGSSSEHRVRPFNMEVAIPALPSRDVPEGTLGTLKVYCVFKGARERLTGVFVAVAHGSLGHYEKRHTAATFARGVIIDAAVNFAAFLGGVRVPQGKLTTCFELSLQITCSTMRTRAGRRKRDHLPMRGAVTFTLGSGPTAQARDRPQ